MKLLLGYMRLMAHISAESFESWDSDFIKKEMFERISKLKASFSSELIDWTTYTEDELRILGFRKWDDKGDWLIPMWLFRLLPDETLLYCPLALLYCPLESDTTLNESILKKNADDDYRMGCSAYSLVDLRKS